MTPSPTRLGEPAGEGVRLKMTLYLVRQRKLRDRIIYLVIADCAEEALRVINSPDYTLATTVTQRVWRNVMADAPQLVAALGVWAGKPTNQAPALPPTGANDG